MTRPPSSAFRKIPVALFVLLGTLLLLWGGTRFRLCWRKTLKKHGENGFSMKAAVSFDATSPTGAQSICFNELPSPYLEQFVDPLPIIPTIDVADGRQHVLKAFKISQKLHRDLPSTTLYAFGTSLEDARTPGPALIARRRVPSYIRWENHISDDAHFLTVDYSIPTAAGPGRGVPMVSHLHGMESASIYDGHPDAWYTQHGETGPKFVTQNYIYSNTLLPAMVWYHDHALGVTRLNIVAGLVGPYIVRGEAHEEPTGLPAGDREIILTVQDKQFFANGSINYPSVGNDPSVHPNWCPGYYGDTILVNGMAWPYLDVLPFKYRLRFLNAGSERYYSLFLTAENSNLKFLKIGTDGGYLPTPVTVDNITLAPSERVDCIVDFGGLASGSTVILNNSAPAPFPGGPGFPAFDPASGVSAVMQFRIGSAESADPSTLPAAWGPPLPNLSHFPADKIRFRRFTLTEVINNIGNGTEVLLANRTFSDPATEFPYLGGTEIWDLISLTPGVDHPMHIHLIKVQLHSIQPINVTRFNAGACSILLDFGHPDSCFLNISRDPSPQEIGWKDIVSAAAGSVTRVVMRFTSQDGSPFRFDPSVGPGYIWHCHLLSHEDNSMMRPFLVQNPASHHTHNG